jgi:hypothetical protein
VQIDAVGKVQFERRPLLNRGEAEVLHVLEDCVPLQDGYRVMAQTSLGELIRPSPRSGTEREVRNAHASINSKRLDFAIIDPAGYLALAIEYQGTGHYQRDAFKRDAVKREALRRAGVALLEVPAEWDAEILAMQVTRMLGGALQTGRLTATR